jgi:hypothetical protein
MIAGGVVAAGGNRIFYHQIDRCERFEKLRKTHEKPEKPADAQVTALQVLP